MSAQVFPVFVAKGRDPDARPPWPLTVACCVYFALLCVGLLKVVPIFAALFAGLGVELPFPTNVLIATYRWSLPVFYLFASEVAVLKQLESLHGAKRRLADATLIFAGILLPPLVAFCMYLPLFVLIHKLHQMR